MNGWFFKGAREAVVYSLLALMACMAGYASGTEAQAWWHNKSMTTKHITPESTR